MSSSFLPVVEMNYLQKILRLESDKWATTTNIVSSPSVAKLYVEMHLISDDKRANFNILIFSLPNISFQFEIR
jgi:hypothetical protein